MKNFFNEFFNIIKMSNFKPDFCENMLQKFERYYMSIKSNIIKYYNI